FVGAQIGSNLECTKGTFENPNGDALTCNGAEIKGGVFLTDGFNAKGKVDFGSAQIGSVLVCTNGTFENPNGDALNCDSAKIESNVFLRDGFNAKGIVNFAATQIGGSLVCTNAKIDGVFDLDSAKAKDLRDSEGFWSCEGLKNISLDGFVYGHIHDDFQAEKRKKWLAKMPEFKPQPYKQLAKVLRDMGHTKDANEIMISYHDKMRNRNFMDALKSFRLRLFFAYPFVVLFALISWVSKLLYGGVSGYGYKPMRTFALMVGIFVSCGYFYSYAANVAVFAPSNPLIFQKKDYYECNVSDFGTPFGASVFEYHKNNNWTKSERLDGEYTTFQPYWYSLDIFLPVVDLQMDKDWGVFIPPKADGLTLNHFTRWVIWLENLMGWALSLILVAILSGLAKNEKD
ncbi:MAG TPA: hypothetical protein PLV58_07795, partial [Campylobacterales bacterium]|nr:hypothetical protein [Campylobacterales bacterium]